MCLLVNSSYIKTRYSPMYSSHRVIYYHQEECETHCMPYALQFLVVFKIFLTSCFDFQQKRCWLLRLFSSVIYIPVFSSRFSRLLFNLLTILRSFYFMVSVNIANTNFYRIPILDYVDRFFTSSLFFIFS